MRRHASDLPHLSADEQGGPDRFGALPRTYWGSALHQTLDRLVKHAAKLSASVFAVGYYVESHLALQCQGLQNGRVFDLVQLFVGEVALLIRGARLQQLRRAQKAANGIRSVRRSHG
jgi:hypothetical protein